MKEYTIIELNDIVTRSEELRFTNPINWKIKSDQHWAVIGANGAGKSLLIDILLGKHALHFSSKVICQNEKGEEQSIRECVKSVAFKDIYSIIDTQDSYYQQRWNKGLENNSPKVIELIEDKNRDLFAEFVELFSIQDLVDKKINFLSSGELRKVLIITALLNRPRILILDNPFIGLDVESRLMLKGFLENLSVERNLQIILVIPDILEIPDFITHILPIKNKTLYKARLKEEFLSDTAYIEEIFEERENTNLDSLKTLFPEKEYDNYEKVIDLKQIHIEYDNKVILDKLDWTVRKGEKWALLGPNGSGKSTLLSLVCGDNPQAYANDITLFDRRRGTGESIWDIKKRIGYISPEMHLYYLKNIACVDVVGSGFFDTIGLYRKCSDEQIRLALEWMKTLKIDYLTDKSFLNISTGEQRLVLLARVLIKNPDLLILDEPMHGLDSANKERVKYIIENFCDENKTLIYVTHYDDEIPDIVNKRLKLLRKIS